MRSTEQPNARRLALSVVLGQAAVTVVAAAASLALAGAGAAGSALLGGAIGTAGTAILALVAFGRLGEGSAERMLLAFFVGELAKIVLVVAAFVVVLKTFRIAPIALLAAYGATFLVYWVVLARLVRSSRTHGTSAGLTLTGGH